MYLITHVDYDDYGSLNMGIIGTMDVYRFKEVCDYIKEYLDYDGLLEITNEYNSINPGVSYLFVKTDRSDEEIPFMILNIPEDQYIGRYFGVDFQ